MFKTLAGLVTAMITCAALLSWMEPPDPTLTTLTDPLAARRKARQAVKLADGVSMVSWESIELVPATAIRAGREIGLKATRSAGHHFLVSEHGAIHVGRAWRQQLRRRAGDATIVVGVSGAGQNGDAPLAAWVGLRALLIALTERLAADGVEPAILLDPSISDTSPRGAHTLLDALTLDVSLSNTAR